MKMRNRHLTVVVCSLLLLSCSDGGTTPNVPTKPSLSIVSGANVSDTIDVRLAQPLVVEVRENGSPRRGTLVRFEALPSTDAAQSAAPLVQLSASNGGAIAVSMNVTTDEKGQARLYVALGGTSGAARIAISAPELSLADTARFTVEPGAAARIDVAPRDTTILVGGSFTLGVRVLDRRSNRRPGEPTYFLTGSAGVLGTAGLVQSGAAAGKGVVTMRAGVLSATATFAVLPHDQIVGVQTLGDGTKAIVSMRLDGSERKVIRPTSGYDAMYSPDGKILAFTEATSVIGAAIWLEDASGVHRLYPTTANIEQAGELIFSADGKWLYFTGSISTGGVHIFRARVDGSALEQLTDSTVGSYNYEATPLPDGERFLFNRGGTLSLRTIATGATTGYPGQGIGALSPDGSRIATFFEVVTVMNLDGTARRRMTCGLYYNGCARGTWSTDGKWIIATGPISVLTNADTGEYIELRYFGDLHFRTVRR